MPEKTKNRHIHKFMRVSVTARNNRFAWKCALPDCSFFVYEKQKEHVEGKEAICWQCGDTFRIDINAMEEELPRCIQCRNPELVKAVIGPTIDDYLAERIKQNESE